MSNHPIQRMRASRLGQSQFERPQRLARAAEGDRSATLEHLPNGAV
jgi:hypothetical protein